MPARNITVTVCQMSFIANFIARFSRIYLSFHLKGVTPPVYIKYINWRGVEVKFFHFHKKGAIRPLSDPERDFITQVGVRDLPLEQRVLRHLDQVADRLAADPVSAVVQASGCLVALGRESGPPGGLHLQGH
jgi:hypothetical protein